MTPNPSGQGLRKRVASMLACCAIVAATLPAMSCTSAPSTAAAPQAPAVAASDAGTAAANGAANGATNGAANGATTEPQDDEDTPDPTAAAASRQQVSRIPTVNVASTGTVSWAYLNRASGARYQSDNGTDTSYTESMVKAWLAADDLRRSAENGWDPDYDLLVPMIIDSDDNAAETIWLNNGADDSIYRMIQVCQLVDTEVYSDWWSMTAMSARDAVSLGQCIADGTAAGPGTDWLLAEMKDVRGEGRFGIIDALTSSDASNVSIKNGWTLHYDDGIWRVNCLAIHPDWIIAVMTTYEGNDDDLTYGAAVCAQVTTQLLTQTNR
jgi:hypothetical protein